MIFYGYFRSSAAYRCRIAFNLKGVAPQTRFINLRDGEQRDPAFLAVNPQGLVPALDTGAGVVGQSLAIIEWLDETHPNPPLLPGDAQRRAQIRSFALAICADTHPLHNLRVLNYIASEYGQDQAGKDSWCQHWITRGLSACETVAQGGTGPFVFGDSPTLADIALIPQMFAADRFGVDLTAYPRLTAIRAHAETLPAFAEAHPKRQPDAI